MRTRRRDSFGAPRPLPGAPRHGPVRRPNLASGVTRVVSINRRLALQPQRQCGRRHPEPVRDLLLGPALGAKPPDFRHALRRELPSGPDLDASRLEAREDRVVGDALLPGDEHAFHPRLVVRHDCVDLTRYELPHPRDATQIRCPPRLRSRVLFSHDARVRYTHPCRGEFGVTSQNLRRV